VEAPEAPVVTTTTSTASTTPTTSTSTASGTGTKSVAAPVSSGGSQTIDSGDSTTGNDVVQRVLQKHLKHRGERDIRTGGSVLALGSRKASCSSA
jgi:hypothetical protein